MRPQKSSIKFGKGAKLSLWFVGSFEITEILGPIPYCIALPSSLRWMHDAFHVSVLHQYMSDPSHAVDLRNLYISDEGTLVAEPIHILD